MPASYHETAAGRDLAGPSTLIVRPGALGDVVLALPAIGAVRDAIGPRATLHLLGYPSRLALAVGPGYGDAALSIDERDFAGLFDDPVTDELAARLEPYGLVVAWCRRLAPGLRRLFEARRVRLVHAAPFPASASKVHATDHLLATLAPLGIGASRGALPRLVVPAARRAAAARQLAEQGLPPGRFVAVHPGSGSAAKNWPAERFARLVERARAEGRPVALVEGPADGPVVDDVRRRVGEPIARLADLDAWDLAAVLAEAAVYVGNDSGVTHLAAAVGTPTVAVFSATDPAVWGPRGPRVVIRAGSSTAEEVWSEARARAR